jgi:hypothetical protein
MRNAFIGFMAGALLAVATAGPRASGSIEMRLDVPEGSKPDVSVSVFQVEKGRRGIAPLRLNESLRYSGMRVDTPPAAVSGITKGLSPAVSNRTGSGKRTAIAIISSAILPGLGELYLYHDSKDYRTLARVPVFIALDGYLWYSYHHNHSWGKEIERNFRGYADRHWSLDRFLHQHPCCNQGGGDSCASWQDYNNNSCKDAPNYFFYTSREIDAQEYYENIGKYNAFVFGWDDAPDWDYNNPKQFEEYNYWPEHRKTYWSLRQESDKYLLRADQKLMLLLVNRVVSMIDAGWIAHRMSKGEDPDKGWSLRLRTYDESPSLIMSRRF